MKSFPIAEANILLVDENRDGLLVRRALLEEQGFQVAMAKSGEEGLRLFGAQHFDVVVTSYRMRPMNGTEFIERIRKLDPNARVVLIARFPETLGLTEASTGADAVLSKDSQEQVLLARSVKRLLNRAPARKPPASQGSPRQERAARPKKLARL